MVVAALEGPQGVMDGWATTQQHQDGVKNQRPRREKGREMANHGWGAGGQWGHSRDSPRGGHARES